jgi:hypothetical protein
MILILLVRSVSSRFSICKNSPDNYLSADRSTKFDINPPNNLGDLHVRTDGHDFPVIRAKNAKVGRDKRTSASKLFDIYNVELRVREITIKNSISVERLLEIIENFSSMIIHDVLSMFLGISCTLRVWIWSRGAHSLQAPYSARTPRLPISKIHKVGAPTPLLDVYIVTCRGVLRNL